MKAKTINIHKFAQLFKEAYNYLYETEADTSEGAYAFDEFVKTHKEFVSEFVKYRGDYISSDRECAAFMMALEELSED